MTTSRNVGRSCLAVALLSTLVLLLWGGYETAKARQYRSREDRLQRLILSLESRRSAEVDAKVWSSGVTWIGIAAGNIFFHRGYTSIEAMSAFEKRLEEKLQQPVDMSIFDWTWDRLSETGPNGKRYVERFRSQMHESLVAENQQSGQSTTQEQIMPSIMNYQFDLEAAMSQHPLKDEAHGEDVRGYSGEIITGPNQLCNNEHLRRDMRNQYNWGKAVTVDLFVMAEGEPEIRHVTKIGGLPYRPAVSKWPTNKNGMPLTFLAQVNFLDSKDLTGHLPGDVLLIFADTADGSIESLQFEWQPIGRTDLISAEFIPQTEFPNQPCYGYLYRTANFPDAEEVPRPMEQESPLCHGKEVWDDGYFLHYQATQIGTAPFFIQGDRNLPGRVIFTLSSVNVSLHEPFPWVNRTAPLLKEGEWNYDCSVENVS